MQPTLPLEEEPLRPPGEDWILDRHVLRRWHGWGESVCLASLLSDGYRDVETKNGGWRCQAALTSQIEPSKALAALVPRRQGRHHRAGAHWAAVGRHAAIPRRIGAAAQTSTWPPSSTKTHQDSTKTAPRRARQPPALAAVSPSRVPAGRA